MVPAFPLLSCPSTGEGRLKEGSVEVEAVRSLPCISVESAGVNGMVGRGIFHNSQYSGGGNSNSGER